MPTITDAHRALVERETEPRTAPYAINEVMARFWCEMVEDANPVYFDETYAGGTWLQGRFAPPAMLFTWGMQPVWAETARPPSMVSRLELDGCTNTVAVNSVQDYHVPLRYGDTLTITHQLTSISDEKTTRLGCGHFVSTKDTFRNQSGEVVGTHTFTLFIYRPAPGEASAK